MIKKTSKSSKSNIPKIVPVSKVSNPRSIVLYGPPGTGKTTLAASWPKPLLLLDMNDKGTDSISDVKGVDVAQITNADQMEALYWELAEERLDYETVVIDTTTQMQQLIIESITGKAEALDFGSLSRRQFGDVAAKMKKYIMDFRDLPLNMIFLAQQRFFNVEEGEEESGDLAEIGPALMPSIATTLNAAVSVIGQTYIRRKTEKKKIGNKLVQRNTSEFCLRIGPDPVIRTKIRKPKGLVPPSYLVNPTYEDLIAIIEGKE